MPETDLNAMAAQDAASSVASVNDVSPANAALGLKSSGPMGVPAVVAARVPVQAQTVTAQSQRQQVFQNNPGVASFVGGADPAHVAAVKDVLPELAKVDYAADAWSGYAGPIHSLVAAFNNASQELHTLAQAGPMFESSPEDNVKNFIKSGKALLDTAGAVWAPLTDPAARTFASVPLPMQHVSLNPFDYRPQTPLNAQGRLEEAGQTIGLAMLMARPKGFQRGGSVPPEESTPSPAPSAPPQLPGPEPIEGDFNLVRTNALPGTHPPTDEFRASLAALDAKGVEGLQETIAENPTTKASPSTMLAFLDHKFGDQTVEVDPEKVGELMAQGHDLTAFDPSEVARAVQSGEPMTVPLSHYLMATSGQSWAPDLNAATNFREGGQSLEDAKETPSSGGAEAGSGPAPTLPEGHGLTESEVPRAQSIAAAYVAKVDELTKPWALSQLVKDPQTLGMTKPQFEAYASGVEEAVAQAREKATNAAVQRVLKEREPQFQEVVGRHQSRLEGEINALPVVNAFRALSEQGFKLNRDLVENFYPEPASRLPKTILHNDGNHPDAVADYLGYPSGVELVRDLADLSSAIQASGQKGLSSYVKWQAKQGAVPAAASELGFDLSPESVTEAARAFVPEDRIKQFLTGELQALGARLGYKLDVDKLLSQADFRFGNMTVRDALNVPRLERVVNRAGVKAEVALQKGNLVRAFYWKQIQLVRRQDMLKAFKFAREYKRAQRLIDRVADKITIEGVSQPAVNWAKNLLAQHGEQVRGNPKDINPPIDGHDTVNDYIAAQVREGAAIPSAQFFPRPYDINGSDLDHLTIQRWRDFNETLSGLIEWGKRQREIEIEGKIVELETAVAQGVQSLQRYSRTITEHEQNHPNFIQKLDHIRRSVDAWLVRNEQLMRDFGARDPRSPFFTYVSGPLHAADAASKDRQVWLGKHWAELTKANPGFDRWLKARTAEAGPHLAILNRNGEPIFTTNQDLFMAALHMGDPQAFQRFATGYFAKGVAQDLVPASEGALESAIFGSRVMDDRAWNMVEGVWDAFDHLAPDIEAMYYRLNGVHPTMTVGRDFTTPEGRAIKGKYFPIIYDTTKAPKGWVEQDINSMLGSKEYVRAVPSNNYIKEREPGQIGPAPVSRQFAGIQTRLQQVIHDLSFRETLIEANKFLMHPDIRNAISTKYGPEYVRKLQTDLKHIAGAETINVNESQAMVAVANYVTQAQMVNMIGNSPTTLMKHFPTAIAQALSEVGPARLAVAYRDFMADRQGTLERAFAESPDIRHMESVIGEDAFKQFLALHQGKPGISNAMLSFAFHQYAIANRHVGIPLYFAAKDMIADKYPGMSEEHLQQAANQIVRQALGSAGPVDAPAALRSDRSVPGQFYRTENNFLTFLSHMYNKQREIPQALGYAGDKVDLGRALGVFMASVVFAEFMDQVVNRTLHKPTLLGTVGGAIEGGLHIGTGGMPIVGAAVTTMLAQIDKEERPRSSALFSTAEMVGKNLADVKKMAEGKPYSNAMLRHAIITGGQIAKFPGLELSRLEGFIVALAEGRENKEWNKIVDDLIHGPKESEHKAGGRRPRL